ncbi:MAG: alpha/beta hydrolase [Gammaproteobacteria bacterium]|nr:MAG: alpha/beta hydrolase [Gammaproteobacteria bacterium]
MITFNLLKAIMLRSRWAIFFSLIVFAISPNVFSATENHRPYTLDRSEVIDFHAKANSKDYEVYIKLPESYSNSPGKKYPLIVLTDGYYAFPLLSSINWRMSERNQVYEQSIIVGISYSKGDDISKSRANDFAPPASTDEKFKNKVDEAGRADLYAKFLGQELLPYLVKSYSVDATRKIYAGHSYGGLLGTYILFTQPNMFDYYLIGSPSLWFNNKVMFNYEASYAKANKDLKAKVYMAAGSQEQNAQFGMVDYMMALDKQLKARHYSQLTLVTETFPGEKHLSVYPTFITRGLLWALPLKNE